MNAIERFKSLPPNTKKSMSIGLILALLVALPLFVWALVNMNFNQQEKAATGEPVDIAQGEPTIGLADAPVTIVMYTDLQCPFCKAFVDDTFSTILSNYPTQVRFVFKDFPITSLHPLAQNAAIAAQCAFAQDKFWEMHDLIFAKQDTLAESDFAAFATQLNLNMTTYNACYTGQTPLAEINADYQEGLAAGVGATPTFIINGTELVGAQPFSAFKTIIDQKLGLTATPTATATSASGSNPTSAPTATPTNAPGEPNSCGGTCGSNYNCKANFYCYQGYCRNPFCSEDKDCNCTSATASPKPTVKATVKPGIITSNTKPTVKGSPKSTPSYTSDIPSSLDQNDEPTEESMSNAPENQFWAKYAVYVYGLFVLVIISTIFYAVKKNNERNSNIPHIVPPTNI